MNFRNFLRTGLVLGASTLINTGASAGIIAFDMVGSASQNLSAYNNPFTDAFGSPGDGFQIYQRGVSSSIPFAVLDDSTTFTSDSIGIVDSTNTDTFFGIVDTQNGDNSGPVTAEWVFDINGASNLSMSIDMGAMGDFENSDEFNWSYSIDGGAVAALFDGIVDESIAQDYTLESGSMFTYNDPMTVNGVSLSNEFMNFSNMINGTGSSLSIFLTATTNGGTEGIAFQNLIISGDAMDVSEPSMLVLFGFGLGLVGFARRRHDR